MSTEWAPSDSAGSGAARPQACARLARGLRVVEWGRSIASALAGMALADQGAEVVRIESPGGDPLATHPAFPLWQRGKTRRALDLSRSEGARTARELALGADVVLASWRPGVAERFGLGAAALTGANPRLVHCAISGFGPRGPHAQVPAYEGIVAARAGRMLELSGLVGGGRPAYAAVPLATYGASQLALHGVLAALLERERSGRGQCVETSLLQALTVYDLVNWLPGSPMFVRTGDFPYLPYTTARTADGVWLQFAQLSLRQFRAFIRDLGLDAIYDDPRLRSAPYLAPDAGRALRARILARVGERTWAEWEPIFDADPDMAVERFRTVAEAMEHPQLCHIGGVVERRDPERGRVRELGPLVRVMDGATDGDGAGPPASPLPDGGGRALGDLVVLELATWVATPLAATLLAELGARVIKVEPPGGEPFRQVKVGAPWLNTMQGKQSIALDLKRPEGREVVHALVRRADALLHNYRPGVPERLGIDYATLRRLNPRLVYLYGASYGSTGPCAHKPAYHPSAGALCGAALAQLGEAGLPGPDVPLGPDERVRAAHRLELANETHPDPSAAVASATALLLGLWARARTGRGLALETTMLVSNATVLSADYVDYPGRPPRERPGADLLGLSALYRLYPAGAGWIFLAVTTEREFERLCDALDRPNWLRDPRFADAGARRRHDADLAAELVAAFADRDAAAWEVSLTARGVACVRADQGPFARFAFEQPWVRESGFVTEVEDPELGRYTRFGPTVQLERDPGTVRGPCRAGEHTRAILAELGYGAEAIEGLERAGVVAAGPG